MSAALPVHKTYKLFIGGETGALRVGPIRADPFRRNS